MKTFRTNAGPFMEKPFFKPEDFERICQDELEQHGLFPSEPAPVRIDRFVEKRFNIRPSYEDLPMGLLGFTLFGPKGVEEIVVSKALDEESTQVAERRRRTTLAHESGHGLLHAHLFAAASSSQPRRKNTGSTGRGTEHAVYQIRRTGGCAHRSGSGRCLDASQTALFRLAKSCLVSSFHDHITCFSVLLVLGAWENGQTCVP